MDQRKRLIELQKDFHEHIEETCPRHHEISCDGCQYDLGDSCDWKAKLADHLLANGVVAVDVDAVSAPNRPLISQCLGHPLDEIIDLIRAKEEGRVIVPPVKVGDTVYMPWDWNGAKGIACLKVTNMSNVLGFGWSVGTDFDTDDEGYADKYSCGRFKFNDFGKSIFLTEKEAMGNQENKLSWSEFKGSLDDGKISEADLKAMYDAYIDDSATE